MGPVLHQGPLLAQLLAAHDPRIRRDAGTISLAFVKITRRSNVRTDDPVEPSWVNDWSPGLATVSLKGLVRRAPGSAPVINMMDTRSSRI